MTYTDKRGSLWIVVDKDETLVYPDAFNALIEYCVRKNPA